MIINSKRMNDIKAVRKIGLWVIMGLTLFTLMVLNVIQETACLNLVVWIALIALVIWLVVMAIISGVNSRKGKAE